MSNYTALYLFVKLDDIRVWFGNDYGFSAIFFLVGVAFAAFYFLWSIDSGISCGDFINSLKRWAKKWAIIVTLAIGVQFTFNAIATILPSTGQMAAIYIGTNAMESDTAEILAKLPAKYATLLDTKADEWLTAQLPKVEK